MLPFGKGEVFSESKGSTWCDSPLDGGVVRQRQEEGDISQNPRIFKAVDEVARYVVFNPHSSKDNGKLLCLRQHLSLASYLGCQLVVG